MADKAVLERVYRTDACAEENFESICSRETQSRPVEAEPVEGRDALRNEYLISVLNTNAQYSISEQVQVIRPSGDAATEEKVTHFELLDTAHGRNRPKMMPTVETADAVVLKAGLALLVVREDRVERASHRAVTPQPRPNAGATR